MPALIDKIAEIKESFHSAEKSIKDCEIQAGELPQGAVNELRYAASHFLDYLENGDGENLEKYYRHCKRAKYDSQELPILMIKGKIDIFLDRFKDDEDILSSKLDGGYIEILDSRKITNELIIKANNEKDNRQDYLEEIQTVLPRLEKSLNSLELAAPAIVASIKKEKSNKRWIIAGVIIAVVAIIVGAILTVDFSNGT